MRVVIVGSGFAGSILARVARVAGHDVTLVERGSHPRFALGESSTPLAAIALERLAARYGLDDLHALAACGRWSARVPELRRGLKRGFTFYRHARGRAFDNDASNRNRLLVAASPDDAAADAHWLREDIDAFLVRRAEAAGVRYLDRTVLDGLERRAGRFHPSGARRGAAVRLEADLIVDASGPGGFLARQLGLETGLPRGALRTGLVYGHFRDVQPLRRVAGAGAAFPAGPYPDELAAVHHLLDEGWMYELTFDHGVVSAGIVIEGAEAWRSIAEHPSRRRVPRTHAALPVARRRVRSRGPGASGGGDSAPAAQVVSLGGRRLGAAAARPPVLEPALLHRHRVEPARRRAPRPAPRARLGSLGGRSRPTGRRPRAVRRPPALGGGPPAPPRRAGLPLAARLRRVRRLRPGVLRGGQLQRGAPAPVPGAPRMRWRVGLVRLPRRYRSGAARNRRARGSPPGGSPAGSAGRGRAAG